MTNISNSMPEEVVAGQPQSDPHQNVSYLYRIQTVDSNNNTGFIWQVGIYIIHTKLVCM